ncbi:hypothetical protein Poli38472_005754 [Pythium oligandrum]|uniref:Uncharacterized protein n=1 Tax=Pythium oligandrum TaxID=41045 RepID=A0A8K1CR40_PYTOL|nr:hypothetical protein Poli38472_005754 [Pythium oligandrum]|eukprot:TMW68286.1 hypothetical protein Poli38472_005754 [Pythium oligandrum]
MWITKTQWKAFKAWMTRTNNLLIILGLFVLDIRDIYYKIAWLGPYETFSFRACSTSDFNPNPLVIVDAQQPTPGASVEFGSGWPSFLARCERLHALGANKGPFFLSALGVNCILRGATQLTRL